MSKYEALVEEVKKTYKSASNERNNTQVQMGWCEHCKEINLWTYWQGLDFQEDNSKIKIMLVGQDWGNCDKGDFIYPVENIKKINEYRKSGQDYSNIHYLNNNTGHDKQSLTDKNLITLFDAIGYKRIDENRYKDLFFTNFCLGYRRGNNSGGMSWSLLKKDAIFFRQLFLIVKPEKVICLGKITYEAVRFALGDGLLTPRIEDFNKFIDAEIINPDKYASVECEGVRSKVYAVAHCGSMGLINRNGKNIESVKSDWIKLFGTKEV